MKRIIKWFISKLPSPTSLKLFLFSFFIIFAFQGFSKSFKNSNVMPDPCTGFKTFTQGGWGATPNGNNPGVYLTANFAAAFPNGITIGGSSRKLVLSSASNITAFLPSGGTPNMLPLGVLTNPGSGYSNTLTGQMVAVVLAVGFDLYDSGFCLSPVSLGNLVLSNGTFAGLTVNQLIVETNNFLNGGPSLYTASQLNSVLTDINENYDNGINNNGFLNCPPNVNFVPLTVGISANDLLCFGDQNGLIISSAFGGNSPYTYLWSNGATSANLSGVGAGTYSVTVTDNSSNTAFASVVISQPALLSLGIVGSNVLCYGDSNGSAVSSSTGGTAPYTYLWSNGSTSKDLSGLIAGTYSLTVTDSNGCNASSSVVISQPLAPISAIFASINASTFQGSNGSIQLTPSGGTVPYSFLWSNGSNNQNLNGLSAGIYSVQIKDAYNCIYNLSITITEPPCTTIGIRTQTQGGWGSKPSGQNNGTYLQANFSTAFPSGLSIGSNGRFLKLISASNVRDFLPSGSTARALPVGTMINPLAKAYSNVLAGQVVTLTINLGLDYAIPSFSPATTNLGSLIATSGSFSGWTVNQILLEANKILGGQVSAFSASQINNAVSAINQNFDNGMLNNGFLICPLSNGSKDYKPNSNSAELDIQSPVSILQNHFGLSVFPNPFKDVIKIDGLGSANFSIKIYDISGRMVLEELNLGRTNQLQIDEKLSPGIYLLNIIQNNYSKSILIIKSGN